MLRHDVRQVALVPLEDQREGLWVEGVVLEVVDQVADHPGVFLEHAALGVRDEHHPVGAGEDLPAGRVVLDLAGHGVQLDAHVHAVETPEIERQQVEEQRAVLLGPQGDHLLAGLGVGDAMNRLEVGRLSGQTGAVVDELEVEGLVRAAELHGTPVPGPGARPGLLPLRFGALYGNLTPS